MMQSRRARLPLQSEEAHRKLANPAVFLRPKHQENSPAPCKLKLSAQKAFTYNCIALPLLDCRARV